MIAFSRQVTRALVLGFSFFLLNGLPALASGIPEAVDGNVLRVRKLRGDTPTSLDMLTQCTESVTGGGTQVCLCRSVGFRIAQIMAKAAWSDDIFRGWDVSVETGWNTDGAKELFSDAAGAASFDYAADAAPEKDLTLADSWYKIRVASTGTTYTFRGTDKIYQGDFLELRAKKQNGTITSGDLAKMQALRKKIVAYMTTAPFSSDSFVVEISRDAAAGGSGSGGCSAGLAGNAALLLLSPLFLTIRKR